MSPFQDSGTTLRLDGCDYATSSKKEMLAETGSVNVTKCNSFFISTEVSSPPLHHPKM